MNHEIDFSTDDICIRAILCRIPFPKDQGKTSYRTQVNSFLSSCLWKRPLQTGCLSEALASSALIALAGSGRLFISPFFTESSPWLIWRLAVRSIEPTVVKTDASGIWELCVLLNGLWKWHKLTEVNSVFSKHAGHLYSDECSCAGQLVTHLELHSALSCRVCSIWIDHQKPHYHSWRREHTTVSWIFHDPLERLWFEHFFLLHWLIGFYSECDTETTLSTL